MLLSYVARRFKPCPCADTVARLGEARHREYDQLYTFFVGLVEAGGLAGGRFTAAR